MRTERIRILAMVANHDEALMAVRQAGDAALVVRGMTRSLVLNCPCGCGDNLTINLDGRVGPAWRFYLRKNALTLFPSYWRDSHCESHFILWNNRVYWCGRDEWWEGEVSAALRQTVFDHLPDQYIKYDVLAEKLGEIPWGVLDACRSLTREGKAERHPERRRQDEFRRSALLTKA